MLIIPAIDLLGRKVVRLRQGAEESAHVYFDNPLEVALDFQEAGAKWIHVVDLDGAFGRPGKNDSVIQKIVDSLSISLELGGGIRSMDRIQFWMDAGIGRIIMGSIAVQKPEVVEEAIKKFDADRVIVGIDARDGKVATHGWTQDASINAVDLAVQMKEMGLERTIITDISTDGMLTGPKLDTMLSIYQKTGLKVIASGGVSCLGDLEEIAKYADAIEGAIIGRAIYEKRFTVKEAVDTFKNV